MKSSRSESLAPMVSPRGYRLLTGLLFVLLLLGSRAASASWPQQIGGSFVDLAHDAVVDADG
ncbi:MAG: hypothetical protein MI919_37210, partial [Holophagales bacterium]|nr:hypothetical protein [Holophagales bacterium]